jgi:hypothetical protein
MKRLFGYLKDARLVEIGLFPAMIAMCIAIWVAGLLGCFPTKYNP